MCDSESLACAFSDNVSVGGCSVSSQELIAKNNYSNITDELKESRVGKFNQRRKHSRLKKRKLGKIKKIKTANSKINKRNANHSKHFVKRKSRVHKKYLSNH